MTSNIIIALAQMNATVGDISGNMAKIRALHADAAKQKADIVICPELSLVGYPPEDLILMPDFRARAMDAVKQLASVTAKGPALLVGTPWEEDGHVFNAAVLLDGGKVAHVQPKTMLPNYGIFDEKRVFDAGEGTVIEWRSTKLGILICEDMWSADAPMHLKAQGAELLIIMNASPFEAGKLAHRREVAGIVATETELPLVYVNLVGGQDDIVFDGGSFALSASGEVVAQLPEFEENLYVIPANAGISGNTANGSRSPDKPGMTIEKTLWEAMKLGLRDYVEKNNFPGIILGLSGGVDSAVTAAVAVDALGAARVKGVLLPSPYSSKESSEDALHSAKLLGIETMNIPITAGMQVVEEVLSPVFKDAAWMSDIAVGGNVQSRLRGLTLMALSNKQGWLLLSTGNKSEIAVGYTTLYGDSCGGYNVLKDLYKTQVYVLANWRNQQGAAIPERSISKVPSAELAPGQTDQDQLPPYDVLDKILYHHIEERRTEAEIVSLGFAADVVKKVVRLVRASEYKRRQSCPGVKLSPMMFGRDRRYPLTNKF